ncbi:MAG: cyclic nucleotide-binding domain-containing protein [Pseudobdellovibrionaceae bacterium]
MIRNLEPILAEQPFFKDFAPEYLSLIESCGKNVVLKAGDRFVNEGEQADTFYAIRTGSVAVETFVPHKGFITLQTLAEGDVLGWSWIFPPYKWTFSVKALQETRALAFDGKCLREKAENDPRLGYLLMKRFAQIMTERLQATRLQLLDVYGKSNSKEDA